ncbi:ABC transporter substrate-binding protein [Nocardia sp. NBC_00565]|uniref:ABC transporter substrate-binding protein n=1 Tax=Nocardia sp. NBC_00565 TaxID=2975993 RepID=UPI002E823F8D|nr:ABC transporter substrate-binding protein [Nocardia sp. NBC_00565]WUC06824.1 ABC transporter substrate-binding protein [Nocardia sp. NBC_00565]
MKVHNRTRFGLQVLVSLVMVAAVTAACGGGGTSSTADGRGADPSKVNLNATLRYAWTVGPNNLDPHQSANYQIDFNYLSPVYDRLTQAVAGPAIAPMLAQSWAFAPDGRSADFKLRTDAKFHDGTPVNAAAVVKSLQRATDPTRARAAGALTLITGIQEIDPTTVRISTSRPAVDLPAALSSTVAAIINPAAIDGNVDLSVETAGSGPYVVDEVRRGDRITYSRFDGYWDPEAQKAAKLEIIGITDDNARLNAFRSGQIDVMLAKAGQADDLNTLLRLPQYRLHSFPAAQYYAVQLDIGQPGLQDPRVRQALNFAIDRNGINGALLKDQCAPISQPIAPGIEGTDQESDGRYTYDPDKARQLLAEAKAPADLRLKVITVAGLSPQQEMATAIQAQLAEVGVGLDIVPLSTADAQLRMGTGKYALLNPRLTYPTPAQSLQSNYLVPLRFPTAPSREFTDAVNASLDPNISDQERIGLYTTASRIASKDAYDVFICGIPTQAAFTDKVFGIDKAGQGDFSGIVDTRYVGKTS